MSGFLILMEKGNSCLTCFQNLRKHCNLTMVPFAVVGKHIVKSTKELFRIMSFLESHYSVYPKYSKKQNAAWNLFL